MLTEAKAIVKTPVTQPDAASKLVASTIARPVRISNTFAVLEDDRDDAACEFVQPAAVVAQPNSATESARTTRPETGKVVQATPQKNQIEKPMGWLDCKIPSCNERCDEKTIQYQDRVSEFPVESFQRKQSTLNTQQYIPLQMRISAGHVGHFGSGDGGEVFPESIQRQLVRRTWRCRRSRK